MVVVLLALLGGFAISLLTGGRFSLLGEVRLHRWWLLLGAVAAQAAGAFALVDQTPALALAAAFASAFLISNRRLRGLGLLAFGVTSNFVAVAANDGAMPVSLTALARTNQGNAGLFADRLHVAASSHTTLRLLTDVIAVPFPFGGGEVLSVGDVLVAAGVGLVVFSATRGHHSGQGVPRWTDGEEGP